MAEVKANHNSSQQADRGRVLKSSAAPEKKTAFQKTHDPGQQHRPPTPSLQLSQANAPVLTVPAAAPPVLSPPRPSTRQLLLYHHWQNNLQRQTDTIAAAPLPDIGQAINQRRGLGSPLPPAIQTGLSNGLGTDLSDVRVHTDSESDQLNQAVQAKAFTTGSDIFFRRGEYNPSSSTGLHLLAHEATHVRQQRQGPVSGTPVAGGVQVSDPQDRFEKEAESTADTLVQRMSLNAAAPPSESNGHSHRNGHHPAPVQRQTALPLVQRCGCGVGTCSCGQKNDELQLSRVAENPTLPPRTAPLDTHTRTLFEHSTGTDLGEVTVHENDPTAQSQFAFAHHDQIHLSPAVPGPEHPLGAQVRLHEMAHLVQSRNGQGVQRTSLDNEQEAHGVAAAALHGQPASIQGTADSEERQDWSWPSLDDIAKMGESALLSLVSRISPGLAQLIREGPVGMLLEKIKDGVKSWIGSLAANFDLGSVVEGLKGAFDAVLGLFDGKEDPASCSAFAQLLNKVRQLGAAFMESAPFQMIKTVFEKVKGFLDKIKSVLLEPAFDVISTIAGGIWDGVKAVVKTIQGWFAAAKEVAGRVWNFVKEKLGISDDGPGLWDWIKTKASEAWSKVKEFFAPIAGPLKVIGTILVVTNPAAWPILIIRYLPPVLDAVEWLWAHRNDPDIIKSARNENKTELVKLLETGKSLGSGISDAANQMVEAITSVGSAVLGFLEAVTGVPLLSGLKSTIDFLSAGAKKLGEWASKIFKKGADKIKEVFNSIKAALAPYIEILTSIGLCIVNPGMIPMVLAGWAWRKLDDCYKPPIIDFLLDIVIGVLENLPAMPMLGPLWPILKAGIIGFLKGVKSQDDAMKIKVTNKLAKIISSPSLGFITGLVKGIVTGLWEGLTDPFKLAYMVLKGLSAIVQWAEGLAGEDVKAYKANSVPTGEVQPGSNGAATPAAGAEELVTLHKVKRGTPPPANGKISSAPTPTPAPTEESVIAYRRPRGSDALPTGEIQPTGDMAPKKSVNSNGDETTVLYRQPRPNEEEIITIRKEGAKPAVPTGEIQPGGGDGKLTPAQAQTLVTGFGQFASDISGPATDVATNFMPAVEEALGKSGDVTLDGLIEKLGDMWTSAEAAIQGFAAELAGKVFQFFAGDQAEEKIGEDVGWVIGTVVFEVILGVLTAGSWTAASPVLKAVQKFAKILDWTGEVVGVVFKGLGKLGGLLFKGKGALSKLLEKAGAAAAKVLEPLERLARRFLDFADEMLGKLFGKAAKEAGEEAGELGAKKLAGEAGEKAGKEAGESAGEAAGEKAGKESGEAAGEKGGKEAGEAAGEKGGKETGEAAGEKGGKEAGEAAGEKGGKEAGQQVGDEAPVVAGGGAGHRPPDGPPTTRLSPEDEFKAALNAGGDGAVAKGRQMIDNTGDMKSLRKKVDAGELGDVDKAREALQKARQQAIDEAKTKVAANVKAQHPDMVFDYKAPGTYKFTSDVDVTVMAKSKQRVDLEALGNKGKLAPDEAARALDDLGFPPGHPQRAELEALLKEGKLTPDKVGQFLDDATIKAEMKASMDAADEFYKVLGDADKKLDANFYTELRVDDMTRKASPADQLKVHHEQSAVSMAEMRRNMSPDDWNAYKKSQLEAVEDLGDPATVARLKQQLEEAERIAKDLEGKTLAQAKQELKDVLDNPNATLSEIREAMAKVKMLEPDAYGSHAAVKDIVDHLQTASRQSDQIKQAIDDAYKANGIDPTRLEDPHYRAEVEDKLLAIDKQIKEQFGDKLDDIAGLRGAHGFEPGSPEHIAFLAQEASANAAKVHKPKATPTDTAKYVERTRYAAREAGVEVTSDISDKELRAMIAAKKAEKPEEAMNAVLKEWGDRTGRGNMTPQQLHDAWMAETRREAQEAVLNIRTAEHLEFENAAMNAAAGKKAAGDGGTSGGNAAAKEGGETAGETGGGAAAKEGGEIGAGKSIDPDTVKLKDNLETVGLPKSYTDNLTPDQLKQAKEGLDRWNLDKNGKNQGVVHTLDYATGSGGAGKANRLEKLEKYTGSGPFDVKDPALLPKVTNTLDELVGKAGEAKKSGEKMLYFFPANNALPPFRPGQQGITIIQYQGKYSTFYNSEYRKFKKET